MFNETGDRDLHFDGAAVVSNPSFSREKDRQRDWDIDSKMAKEWDDALVRKDVCECCLLRRTTGARNEMSGGRESYAEK